MSNTFAVMLSEKLTSLDGILLMVDDRREAEEIAIELRRKGHSVTVREVPPETSHAHDATESRSLSLPAR